MSVKNSDEQEKSPKIIGNAYKQLKDSVKRAAKSDIPILLIGERGSGKEVFAQYYMIQSNRMGEKMAVDCAAFPDTLLRSEIFGHEKGAFTDAIRKRDGKLIHCNGGVLCLDELGDATEAFQAAILRIVEKNSFSKVGSDKEETDKDTLVIAATNKPQKLRAEIKDRFNLFYVPPLQKGDIPALATYFLQKLAHKTDVFPREDIIDDLMAREYPGNVRQLKRNCERLFIDRRGAVLGKRRSQPLPDVPPFDYERFVREYQFWLEYIQPLIEKVSLAFELSYVYQPWKNDPEGDYIWSTIEDLSPLKKLHLFRHGKGDFADYTQELENLIKKGSLPHYIADVRNELKLDAPPLLEDVKPNLSSLLDMASPKQAAAEFKRYYFQYHMKKNGSNMKKTAQSLGTTASALRQMINRLK